VQSVPSEQYPNITDPGALLIYRARKAADIKNRARLPSLDVKKPVTIELGSAPILVCIVTRLTRDEGDSNASAEVGAATLDTRIIRQVLPRDDGGNLVRSIGTRMEKARTALVGPAEPFTCNTEKLIDLFDGQARQLSAAGLPAGSLTDVIPVFQDPVIRLSSLKTIDFDPPKR